MDPETRIKLYMGKSYYHSTAVRLDMVPVDQRPLVFCYADQYQKDFDTEKTTYFHDMTRYIYRIPSLYDTRFLFYPRDRVEPFHVPTLVKSRQIDNPGESIIMNMNFARHFGNIFNVDENDIPYSEKTEVLVWRGVDTGYGFGNNIPYRDTSRETMLTKFYQHDNLMIDIGLSKIEREDKKAKYGHFIKNTMDLWQLLKYKFLLSVEGNDVATNLKWILYSNSVPFCTPFTIQSWILEDQLVPYIHFIPIRSDFEDLEEKIEWAIKNPRQCEDIAHEGRKYISQFLDMKKERNIIETLLFRYSQRVHVGKDQQHSQGQEEKK